MASDYVLGVEIEGNSSKYQSAVKSAENATSSLENTLKSIEASVSRAAKSIDSIAKNLESMSVAGKKAADSSEDVSSNLNDTEKAATKAETSIGEYNDTAGERVTQQDIAKPIEEAEKAATKANNALKKMQTTLKSVSDGMKTLGDKFSSFGKVVMAAETAIAGVMGVGVKYNATIEELQTSFEVMTGSAEKAAGVIKKLKTMGAATPFEFTDLASATNLLMQFGFSAEDAMDSLQMLGDISQGNAQKLDTITRAFGRMTSSSKVTLEDINMMIDSGFNPLQQIADQTGESMASIYDRISQGTMSVEEVTAAMKAATAEGGQYFGMMDKQSQTLNGQLSTLADNAQMLLGNISTGVFDRLRNEILPAINDALSAVNDAFEVGGFQGAIDEIKKFSPALDEAITKVEEFASFLNNLGIDPAKFAGIAAAIGPVSLALGKILTMSSGVLSFFSGLFGVVGKVGTVFLGLSTPLQIVVVAIGALAAAFGYLMTSNDEFRESVIATAETIISSVQPILQALGEALTTIGQTLGESITGLLQQIAPLLSEIVLQIGALFETASPLIAALIEQLVPVIQTIIDIVTQILSTLLPPLLEIISQVILAIQQILPPVASVLEAVIGAISSILEALAPIVEFIAQLIADIITKITPIISFVAEVISTVMNIIAPIIDFIGEVIAGIIDIISGIISAVSDIFDSVVSTVEGAWNSISSAASSVFSGIKNLWSGLTSFFSNLWNRIKTTTSNVFSGIKNVISNVFKAIQNAWSGLTSFVGGIFDSISSGVSALVSTVKSVINGVIGAINGAIWVINLIPGVNIGSIPYLAHGTDDWQGGFARMNEGGRGELTYLPNGAQVIPHDISVKYAKESARVNASAEPIDLSGVMEGMVIQVINNTNVDGTPLKETVSDFTIRKIGNQQRAVQRSRGIAYV